MEMLYNARDCDKIRKKVLILSSIFFTIQGSPKKLSQNQINAKV
jgi:hypothetical protein